MKIDFAKARSVLAPLASADGTGSVRRLIAISTLFSTAVFFLIFSISVLTSRALYADGGYLFLMSAQSGTFFNPGMEGSLRVCAHYLTQALVVLSLKLGVRDLQTLGMIFSFNEYLVPFLSLVACLKILRDKRYVIFPILSYLFGTLQVYSMINSESHVLVALFWPMFFIILDWEEMTTVRAMLLPLLAVCALDCYESALFLSLLLMVLIAFKFYQGAVASKSYGLLVAALLAGGVVIAVQGMLKAHGSGNEASFFDSMKTVVKYDVHLYVLALLVAISFAMHFSRWKKGSGWIVALIVFSAALLIFSFRPDLLRIPRNYGFRIVLLIFPLVLALGAFGIKVLRLEGFLQRRWLWRAVVLATAYSLAVQLGCSFQWYGYQQIFRSYLLTTKDRGLVEYRETPLALAQAGPQLIRELNWYWILPSLSIIWAKDGQVNTLIYSKDTPLYGSFPLDQPPSFPPDFHIDYPYLEGGLPPKP